MTSINGLTDKQTVWLNSYLKCWNGAQAARDASYESVYQSAHDNLTNPKIREIIRARLQGQAMGADETLQRLAEHARADIGDLLGKGGVIDLEAAKEAGLTHLIKSISWTKTGLRIEMYDAQRALGLIGKGHGIFKERIEHTGKDGEPIKTIILDVNREGSGGAV